MCIRDRFLAGSDNPMYGALGGVILLITWMYYTNILLLLGAEVAGLYRRVRVGAMAPTALEAHRRELEAVHAGHAMPLSSAPSVDSLPDAKKHARATMESIKGNVQAVGQTLKSTAHDVRVTPARNNAERAFETEPDASDRREMEVASTARERRPPTSAPHASQRTFAGALGGETPDPESSLQDQVDRMEESREQMRRDQERRAIEERAEREMEADDYPPVTESKRNAKETVEEIKANVQTISRTVKQARGQAADGS